MLPETSNPPIAPLLRALLWLTTPILLGAGVALFFFPDWARPLWPWQIGPFDAAFLGAFYLSAGTGILVVAWTGRWFPARVILPMIFVVTATLLLFSLLELGRFFFAHWTTYGWFIIYLGLPVMSGLALWLYRAWPVPLVYGVPSGWRGWLVSEAMVFGLYGIALFLFPTAVGAHWPWPVDGFHGRLYSVIFTAGGIGLLGLAQWSAPSERFTLGVASSVMGLFAIFGVAIVDAARRSVVWDSPGVLLWLALLGIHFVTGLALVWWSSTTRPNGAQPSGPARPGPRR
jgi:hypothetical protein